jgi:hypothetical protein
MAWIANIEADRGSKEQRSARTAKLKPRLASLIPGVSGNGPGDKELVLRLNRDHDDLLIISVPLVNHTNYYENSVPMRRKGWHEAESIFFFPYLRMDLPE